MVTAMSSPGGTGVWGVRQKRERMAMRIDKKSGDPHFKTCTPRQVLVFATYEHPQQAEKLQGHRRGKLIATSTLSPVAPNIFQKEA